jgi:hypothetical protein
MKPLKKLLKIWPAELSLMEYREVLISILNNASATVIRLKDGTLLNLTLKSDNTLTFDEIEPYFEFDSEKEIRDWVESDNEYFFENVVRWHTLNSILDGEDEPLK